MCSARRCMLLQPVHAAQPLRNDGNHNFTRHCYPVTLEAELSALLYLYYLLSVSEESSLNTTRNAPSRTSAKRSVFAPLNAFTRCCRGRRVGTPSSSTSLHVDKAIRFEPEVNPDVVKAYIWSPAVALEEVGSLILQYVWSVEHFAHLRFSRRKGGFGGLHR